MARRLRPAAAAALGAGRRGALQLRLVLGLGLLMAVAGLRWSGRSACSLLRLGGVAAPQQREGPGKQRSSGEGDRLSRYSPEKRRLRPDVLPQFSNATRIGDESFPGGSANAQQRLQLDSRSIAAASSSVSTARKFSYRSSYEMSSILMSARRKENADVIVAKLAELLANQNKREAKESSSPRAAVAKPIDRVKLKEFNMLLKELGDNGHLEQCDKILAIMKAEGGVQPSLVTFSTLISKAGIWQKLEQAEKYFQQMLALGIAPDVPAYNGLANAYAKGGQSDAAFDLVRVMESRNLQPSLITFNTLIDSCAHSGNISRALGVLDMIKARGMIPNARTYSSLIHTCCQAKDMDQALQLLTKMREECFDPTDVTLSLVMHGLGQSGDLQRAFDVLEAMKDKGLRPNVVTMSSLVYACGKHGQLDRAFALYEEMSANEDLTQRPNSITCSSLIDACLKGGEVDRAFTVIRDMRTRNLPMTQVTYTSLITELTKLRQSDRILEVIREAPLSPADASVLATAVAAAAAAAAGAVGGESGAVSASQTFAPPSPPIAAATAASKKELAKLDQFIARLEESGRMDEIKQLRRLKLEADRMEACLATMDGGSGSASWGREKLTMTNTTTTRSSMAKSLEVSSAFLSSVETARFIQQLLDMPAAVASGSSNIPTEPMFDEACRFLLNECGKASRCSRVCVAPDAWAEDATAEFIRDRGNSYANIVEAYQWIKNCKMTPCLRIYNQLLRVVNDGSVVGSVGGSSSEDAQYWGQQRMQLKQDELFRLYLVFQEMRVSGVQIDAATYNTLINACAVAGNLEKAIETVQSMQEEGIYPNVITYTSLIKACRHNGSPGSVQLAEYYFLEMQQKNNHFSRYIEPTTYTYLQLMKTHLQAIENGHYGEGDTRRVWDLLEILLRRKLKPSIHVWRECVAATIVEEDVQKALDMLSLIRKQQGVDPKSWQAVADFFSSRPGPPVVKSEEAKLRQELAQFRRAAR